MGHLARRALVREYVIPRLRVSFAHGCIPVIYALYRGVLSHVRTPLLSGAMLRARWCVGRRSSECNGERNELETVVTDGIIMLRFAGPPQIFPPEKSRRNRVRDYACTRNTRETKLSARGGATARRCETRGSVQLSGHVTIARDYARLSCTPCRRRSAFNFSTERGGGERRRAREREKKKDRAVILTKLS